MGLSSWKAPGLEFLLPALRGEQWEEGVDMRWSRSVLILIIKVSELPVQSVT
jgi:hypothetical protein